MKKLLSVAAATMLAASFAMPLNAAPMFMPKPEQARTDAVENVNYSHRHHHHHHGRYWRSPYYGYNRYYHGYHRPYYHGYHRPYHYGYYRPYHHGYYRPYYRPYYPGYYYPQSGFSLYLSF